MNKRKPTNKEVRERLVPQAELLADLYAIVERKCRRLKSHNPIGGRGTLCVQLFGDGATTYLFIMEGGYRSTLFPRLVYKLSGGSPGTYEERLREAIRAEREEDNLVAKVDSRPATTLVNFEYDLDARDVDTHDFSKEVSIARARRSLRAAKEGLRHAEAWFTRACGMPEDQ